MTFLVLLVDLELPVNTKGGIPDTAEGLSDPPDDSSVLTDGPIGSADDSNGLPDGPLDSTGWWPSR